MLIFLLAILLQINNIDYSPAILHLDNNTSQSLISQLVNEDYNPPFKINRYLSPIQKSPFIWPAINITAESVMVIDVMSGKELFEKNSNTILPIASLTKLMTAIVFLETNPDFDQEVIIESSDNVNVEGSRLYVKEGEKMTVGNLFYASLVGSANNATKALARSTNLSENDFLQKMNSRAVSLGLVSTNFYDVTGLDPKNTSTVREYAKIASHAFRNSKIKEALSLPEYQFVTLDQKIGHRIINTNKLLGDDDLELIGAKTGYINEAGFTYAVQVIKDGHEVLIVLFKSNTGQSRFTESKELAQWVFKNFNWY